MVCYSSLGRNNGLFVHYSDHGLNNGPFDDRTHVLDFNTGQICYSTPHCTFREIFQGKSSVLIVQARCQDCSKQLTVKTTLLSIIFRVNMGCLQQCVRYGSICIPLYQAKAKAFGMALMVDSIWNSPCVC